MTDFDDNVNETKSEEDKSILSEDFSSFSDGFYTKQKSDIIQDSAEDSVNKEESFNTDTVNNKSPYIKEEKKKYSGFVVVLAVVLAALIGAGSSLAVTKLINSDSLYKTENLPQISEKNKNENTTINVDENASSIAEAVAAKCTKSVVGIRTTTSVASFFGGVSESTGSGSGVVYMSDGYIVTNYHVVENAVVSSSKSKIEVFLDNANTKPYTAKVVGYNIACDLAVLKIDANNLPVCSFGNSDNLKTGQYVITIGAPGGLEFMGSVTYGVISGLNRVVSSNSSVGLIQTDAAINPGNSGGALLDASGNLIGINSSKIVSEEFENMGFAIPINSVVEICNKIISNKDSEEPYVGITVSDKYTAAVLESYGYPVGAVVLSVATGSTAESCGIKKGDIITKFSGTEITEYNVFDNLLKNCSIGETVEIEVYRNGKIYKTEIKIASNG